MTPKRLAAWPLLAAVALLTGCMSTAPNYEARFGEAVRHNLQAQTLNPQAVGSIEPVRGMDGMSSREATQRYRDSFKAPPPVVNVINIGGVQ